VLREAVVLSELDPQSLLASQGYALFKKRKLKARMLLARLMGRSVPLYRQKLLRPVWGDYRNMIKLLIARYVVSGNHRVLRSLFHIVHRPKSGESGKGIKLPAPANRRENAQHRPHPGDSPKVAR
jgi:hypothetical protein